jgi:hypothetical protein
MSDEIFEKIAKDVLGIPTLKTQNSDRADYHEVSVWKIRQALQTAYTRGVLEARLENSQAPLDYKYDGD